MACPLNTALLNKAHLTVCQYTPAARPGLLQSWGIILKIPAVQQQLSAFNRACTSLTPSLCACAAHP